MSNKKPALFIGFLVVAAIIVIMVVQKNSDKSQNPNSLPEDFDGELSRTADQPSAEPVVASDGSYTVLQSTDTLVIGEIITYRFGEQNSLSVMPAAMQGVVLNETPTVNESDITVAGQAGKKLTLSSAKDGSPFTVVQVVVNDQLFDFRGTDLFLDTLSQYVQFNQVNN